MTFRLIWTCCFFILCSSVTFGQDDHKLTDFREEVLKAQHLMSKNPDKAFFDTNELLKSKAKYDDSGAFLILLHNRCQYYLIKSDFTNLMNSAQYLRDKSIEHKDAVSEANSYAYLSNAYALNGLYEEAESTLIKGLDVLKNLNLTDNYFINTKAKLYTELANVANIKKQPREQIRYMRMAVEERSKLSDKNLKKKLQFWDLSNLAATYYDFDIDSAEYYALQSVELSSENELNTNPMFSNYLILGVANKFKNNYTKAISYYKKAEAIKENKHHLNIEELYNRFIEIYEATGDSINTEKYKNKINLLRLTITESKNRSLHTIIEENKKNNKSETYILLLIGTMFLICVLAFFLIRFYRKNQILKKQEFQSQNYLEEIKSNELQDSPSVKELIEIVSNNEPGFLFAFERIFPDFTGKLLSIYPEASKSEIEFCALIKLNLSTKEIARYKVIHVRSVQNRKYRIRKNLNIPAEMDIYDWFKNF